jgi:hypothetical protein
MNDENSAPIDPAEMIGIDPTGGLDDLLIFGSPATRRRFLKQIAGTGAAIGLGPGSVEPASGGTRPPISSA